MQWALPSPRLPTALAAQTAAMTLKGLSTSSPRTAVVPLRDLNVLLEILSIYCRNVGKEVDFHNLLEIPYILTTHMYIPKFWPQPPECGRFLALFAFMVWEMGGFPDFVNISSKWRKRCQTMRL